MLNIEKFSLFEGFESMKKRLKKQYNKNKKVNLLFLKSDEVLKRIISLDPTSNEKKDATGKYSQWMIKMLLGNDEDIKEIINNKEGEDDYRITDTLSTYHKNKKKFKKKNIYEYTSLGELMDSVSSFLIGKSGSDIGSFDDRLQERAKNGDIELFFVCEKWTIIIPKNKEASCFFGSGTKWCTADRKTNAFSTYSTGPLYMFLDNENNLEPEYQFYFETGIFMDKKDRAIEIKEFFNNNKNVFDHFYPEIIKQLNNEENLSSDGLQYIPMDYLDDYFKYYDCELINALNDLEKIENDDALMDKYIGYIEYDYDIDKRNKIITLKEEDLKSDIDFDDYDFNYKSYLEPDGLVDILRYFHYQLLTDDIRIKLDELKQVTQVDTSIYDGDNEFQYCDIDDEIDLEHYKVIKLLGLEDYGMVEYYLRESNRIIEIAADEEFENIAKKLVIFKDHGEIEIRIEQLYLFIIENDLHNDYTSIEEIIASYYETMLDRIHYETLINLSHENNTDTTEIDKKNGVNFLEKIQEVIDDIETYGNTSDYYHGNNEYIETLKQLRAINIKLNKTYDFGEIQYSIYSIQDEFILLQICKINKEKTWGWNQYEKITKHKIKPSELMEYVQNYKLDILERIINFKKFKKMLKS